MGRRGAEDNPPQVPRGVALVHRRGPSARGHRSQPRAHRPGSGWCSRTHIRPTRPPFHTSSAQLCQLVPVGVAEERRAHGLVDRVQRHAGLRGEQPGRPAAADLEPGAGAVRPFHGQRAGIAGRAHHGRRERQACPRSGRRSRTALRQISSQTMTCAPRVSTGMKNTGSLRGPGRRPAGGDGAAGGAAAAPCRRRRPAHSLPGRPPRIRRVAPAPRCTARPVIDRTTVRRAAAGGERRAAPPTPTLGKEVEVRLRKPLVRRRDSARSRGRMARSAWADGHGPSADR